MESTADAPFLCAGQYSTQIFALAVLLSSLFVYNQLGAIDEAALDRLALVSEVSRSLSGRAASGAADPADDLGARYAPSFLWLLRDFYLDLTEDGRPITPKEYLETALRSTPGSGPAVESKNQIRRSICTLFPRRDCHALVRPVSDERLLQQLDSVPTSQLRPEFVAGVQALTAAVLAAAGPKRLAGDVLNGPALARLAETYVQALNTGAVPPIASAWEAVAAAECAAAAAAGDAAYETAVSRAGPSADADQLTAVHAAAVDAAKSAFTSTAVGPSGVREVHWTRLLTSLDRRFTDRKARAFAEAAAANAELLHAATTALTAAARAPGASVEGIIAMADKQAESYMRSAQGPHKAEKLVTWLRGALTGPICDAAAAAVRTASEAMRAAKTAAEEAQRAAVIASRCEGEARQEAQQLKERLNAATAAASAAERSAAAAREQANAAASSAHEQAQKAQDLGHRVGSASAELASLRARLEQAQQELQQAQREATLAKSDAQAARDQARSAQTQAQAEAAARAHAEAATAAAARDKTDMQAGLANRLAALQGEADEAVNAANKRYKRGSVSVGAGGTSDGAGPSAPSPAAAPQAAPPSSPAAASMTMAGLKAALVEAGHEDAVAQLAQRKPAPKKQDFMDLYDKLMQQ